MSVRETSNTYTTMSLLLPSYSSDEDDVPTKVSEDAFSISSIPAQKKRRVEESVLTKVDTSAPDVLSEVSSPALHYMIEA